MAYQVQSPYGQGSAIDTHLQGLVGAESDAANRGLAAANLAQSQQEMAQRGQIEQARLAQQGQLAGMEQQMQAERLASAERLQQGSQAFQAQQNQILIAEQRRIAEQEKKDAMEMMELDAQLTLAEAKQDEAAMGALFQQRKALAQRRSIAARNQAVMQERLTKTPEALAAMGEQVQSKLAQMKSQLDAKKVMATNFLPQAQAAIASLNQEGGSRARKLLQAMQEGSKAGMSLGTSGISSLFGQDVPQVSNDALTGLQYLNLQGDVFGFGGFLGSEERSAGMVGGMMSEVSMTQTVANQTAQGLVNALATVPGAKVDRDNAILVFGKALTEMKAEDLSQEFLKNGIEPEVAKLMMQDMAKAAMQESNRISLELSGTRAGGAQESLNTKALEAAARSYSIRAEQLARGASRIASMDFTEYEAMGETFGRLRRVGDYGALTGLTDQMEKLGLGSDYGQMLDLIGAGQGPIQSRADLERQLATAMRETENVAAEEVGAEADLMRELIGGRTRGAEERARIIRSRMP